MKSSELIGLPVVAYLNEKLTEQEEGRARFLVDCVKSSLPDFRPPFSGS